MTFRSLPVAAALVLFASTATIAQDKLAPAAQSTSKPVSVNGKLIPRARLDYIIKQRAAQGQPDNEQIRRSLLDNLINQELLSQEAERRGFSKNPDIQIQMDLTRQSALARAVVEDYLKTRPIGDDALKAQYENVKAQRGETEYRARHILVDTEATARDIVEKLKKGEKFEDLAKQSKDPGSKDRGGDLDWASPGNYVKPFSDALVKLTKGKVADASVQSQLGWHVIRLDDVRSTQFPPFDQVRQQIQSALQDQEVQKLVGELRAKAKIE